jgi:NAD(P)-dependent dehydrogenase (short-subunit alcohol dehydrogenase family)
MPRPSKAAGSVALVTGANRGIGLAFVRELAARGAKKVYAGVRSPDALAEEFAGLAAEVVPLDVTDQAAVTAAANACPVADPRDPAAMARTWAAIIGIEPPVTTADGAVLAFGRRTVRFVPARGGRTGIVAVDVHATDREHGTGQQGMLCHTMINFI